MNDEPGINWNLLSLNPPTPDGYLEYIENSTNRWRGALFSHSPYTSDDDDDDYDDDVSDYSSNADTEIIDFVNPEDDEMDIDDDDDSDENTVVMDFDDTHSDFINEDL